MTVKAERTLQQVKMSDDLHKTIKMMAVQKNTFMNDIYDEAVTALLNARKFTDLQYLASPKNGKAKSLWLANDVHQKAKALAERDQVPMNRVVYTAIVHYCKSEGPA